MPPTPGEFQRWAAKIPDGGRSFNFIHMELPHEPFHFLPNGQSYNFSAISDVAGPNAQKWAAGEGGVATTQQRHLIQNAYADRLVSLLISDLKRRGIWDKALVVVTADHGIDFDPKTYRRIASPGDFGGIANSPLFIKYPGQKTGKVSETHTHTIDIVPTIARELGVDLPYKTEGEPIVDDGSGGRVVIKNGLKTTVSEPFEKMLAERREILFRNKLRFGADTGIWQLGPRSDLLGKPAPPISGAGSAGSASLDDESLWSDVRLKNEPQGARLRRRKALGRRGQQPDRDLGQRPSRGDLPLLPLQRRHLGRGGDTSADAPSGAKLDRDLLDRGGGQPHPAGRELSPSLPVGACACRAWASACAWAAAWGSCFTCRLQLLARQCSRCESSFESHALTSR